MFHPLVLPSTHIRGFPESGSLQIARSLLGLALPRPQVLLLDVTISSVIGGGFSSASAVGSVIQRRCLICLVTLKFTFTFTLPSGSLPSNLFSAGVVLDPPGVVLVPTSVVLVPTGVVLVPTGVVVVPTGVVLVPTGVVVVPTGVVVVPTGVVVVPTGVVLVPTGVVLVPTDVVQVPTGEVLLVHTLLYPLLLSHAPLYPNPPSNLLCAPNVSCHGLYSSLLYNTIPFYLSSPLKPPSDTPLFCIMDPNHLYDLSTRSSPPNYKCLVN